MTTLYRPVGLDELALIWDSGCREFPPRLPEQPIFYPVTSAEYATQIARDWNSKASSFAGYVTSFDVEDGFLSKYERHIVGSAQHEEYWIPAEQLPGFNEAMRSPIEVEAAFFGELFTGFIPDRGGFRAKNADEQFLILARNWDYSRMDFALEISPNQKAIHLNCAFWLGRDFIGDGITPEIKTAALNGLIHTWRERGLAPALPAVFLEAFGAI